MSLAEGESSNAVPPEEQDSTEEKPFQPTDPFWTNTNPNISDKQIIVGAVLHEGHQLAHGVKEEVKGLLKGLFGIR